ncbi:MAG: protein kinase [Planctomycetota bacterium]
MEDAARVADRFELERKLGAGAFGEAHVARDTQSGRRVVLKLIHPQYAENAELVERFRREVRALERVKHPCIPELVAHGTDATGRVYYAMEFCEGKDLYHALEDEPGQWPLKRCCLLFDDLLSALAAAHEAGVVHRDLKPANLILTKESGLERLKLIDFGIAKHLSGGERTTIDITGGRAVGTPFYLSPEGASGEPVDPRSDLYAAGVIFYEMLTDQRPVKGSTVRAILTSILRDPAPRIREVRPDVPEGIERLILGLMAKDPQERPGSAAAVKTALREACPQAFQDVSSTAVTVLPGHTPPTQTQSAQAADPYLDKTIAGKYELRELLGQGGFGRVYRAWHTELDMPVALKLISFAGEGSPEVLAEVHERFKREARAMRSFVHKHAVQVRDFGRDGDLFYLELDFVEGRTLDATLAREGTLEEGRALKIAGQVLSALAEAHKAGIVHRDLKPANIMISEVNGEESARILDFGIVKLMGAMEDRTSPGLTGAGVAIGTVQYMSPEQAGGDPVAFPSDVYSLATVLYKCLAGRLPIEAGDAGTQASLRARIMTREPDPLKKLAPQVSDRTAKAVMRALSKDAKDRPPDAAAFAEELLAGTPYLLLPGATSLLTPALPRDGGGGAVPLALLGVLVVVVLGLGGLLVPAVRARLLAAIGVEPVKTEPVKTEPGKTKPGKTEPAKTGETKTEPAKTEPAKTGETKTEPAKTGETKTGPVEPPKREPSLELDEPRDGAEVRGAVLRVAGRAEAPAGSRVQVLRGGEVLAAQPLSGSRFELEVKGLPAGSHSLEVRLLGPGDLAGPKLSRRVNVVGGPGVPPPWWTKVEAARRPTLPLPAGLRFGEGPGTYVNEKDGSVLVFVAGGDFAMGEDGRKTHVEPFFLGKLEVTRAQLAKVLGRPQPAPADAQLPATLVSYAEAEAYCKNVGLRLPSEAEWEIAARGPEGRPWPWGSAPLAANLANVGGPRLAPVGSLSAGASPEGALDLIGNASEWVDGWKASDRRAVKGGSYRSHPSTVQPTKTLGFKPAQADREELGFRVARGIR